MSGDAMRGTLQVPPTSEGDIEKSSLAPPSSPAPRKLKFERPQPRTGRDARLQIAPSDGATHGNAERGRPATSVDGLSAKGFSRLKRRPGTEVFTELPDVKSRTSWTAERRKLLEEMWDRGEKASAIAAALGSKVGAVNVARAVRPQAPSHCVRPSSNPAR
jgi:hypothetical protein